MSVNPECLRSRPSLPPSLFPPRSLPPNALAQRQERLRLSSKESSHRALTLQSHSALRTEKGSKEELQGVSVIPESLRSRPSLPPSPSAFPLRLPPPPSPSAFPLRSLPPIPLPPIPHAQRQERLRLSSKAASHRALMLQGRRAIRLSFCERAHAGDGKCLGTARRSAQTASKRVGSAEDLAGRARISPRRL